MFKTSQKKTDWFFCFRRLRFENINAFFALYFFAWSTMLIFVNISAYLGCYVCLFLLLKALKRLLLNDRALIIAKDQISSIYAINDVMNIHANRNCIHSNICCFSTNAILARQKVVTMQYITIKPHKVFIMQ